MADRNTLAFSKLEDFKEWLISDGYELENTVGNYEVLRAVKPNRKHPLIIYKKSGECMHLSVLDRDMGVVRAYLKSKKNKPLTNYEKIKNMSIEQMAKFIYVTEMQEIDYNGFCDLCKDKDCINNCIKQWLESEAKSNE